MANFSSTDVIERIRASINIYDLVKEYVPELKQNGRNFKARCPFHNEKTPSFIVSPDKGIFHCFGCGLGGDIFKFVMNIENIDFKEALFKLGGRAGVDVKSYSNSSTPRQNSESRAFYKILEDAKEFYHEVLLSGLGFKARRYLESRGLKQETITKFEIGFAPQSGSPFLEWAVKRGHSVEHLCKLGLAAKDQTRNRHRDYFWNRIMFPILDSQGRTCGFGGRVLDTGEPKFLNSPDSPVFSKSRLLYGLFNGAADLRAKKTAILLEGYIDVITAHQEGAGNAVASLGTALTNEQVKLLKRYVQYCVISYDPDNAGRMASSRSADILIENGFYPKIAVLPDNLDADDYIIKYGVKSFQELTANSKEVIDFKIDLYLDGIKPRGVKDLSLAEKTNFIKGLLAPLNKAKDTIYRSESIKVISERLNIQQKALLKEFENTVDISGSEVFAVNDQSGRLLSLEEEVINILLANPDCLEKYCLKQEYFKEPFSKKVFEIIKKMRAESKEAGDFCSCVLMRLEQDESDWITQNILLQHEKASPAGDMEEKLIAELKKSRLKDIEKLLSEKVCRMLNKLEPSDSEVFAKYRDVTRLLKGQGGCLDINTLNKYI